MKLRFFTGMMCLIVSSTVATAQDVQGCGTPAECYVKAAAGLNNAVKTIENLQTQIDKLKRANEQQQQSIDTMVNTSIPALTAQVKTPSAQVGLIECNKSFTIDSNPETVQFAIGDCQGKIPVPGWTYVPVLISTDIAGGFSEYKISTDLVNPYITFFGNFTMGAGSSVQVDYIGFKPRAF